MRGYIDTVQLLCISSLLTNVDSPLGTIIVAVDVSAHYIFYYNSSIWVVVLIMCSLTVFALRFDCPA